VERAPFQHEIEAAHGILQRDHLALQQVEEVLRVAGAQPDQAFEEVSEQQRALVGLRVGPDHRVPCA
jgi:hypothetical protein